VTAVAEDGRRLEVELDGPVAQLAIDTLDVFIGVAVEALGQAGRSERESLSSRVSRADAMRRTLGYQAGTARLSGDEGLVVDVVRAVASHAAYELDVQLEGIAGGRATLDEEAVARLHHRGAVATAAVDALIACEAARRTS
jgi:hypothetical protein